jgi:hypothetical protein
MAGASVGLDSPLSVNCTFTETDLLDVVHLHYAWVLFVVFIAAYVTNIILAAEPSSEAKGPVLLGPGGKPLPRSVARKKKEERERRKKLKDFSRGRKLLFLYLSIGLLATFVVNAINIIIHALTKSENGWWCGEATAVSRDKFENFKAFQLTLQLLDIRLCFSLLLQHLPHLHG